MIVRVAVLTLVVVLFGMVGYLEATTETTDGNAVGTDSKAAPPAQAMQTEDRGNAHFTTAGKTWVASFASARQTENRLRIKASEIDFAGDKIKRDELLLAIMDYRGPGRYKASPLSMFVRIGIDMPRDKAGQVEAQKTLMDTQDNTDTLFLDNAVIEIISVSEGYIDGTFSIEKPAGTPESTITDGHFHARIRE